MFKNINEIKSVNRAAGKHFFDADTMRFFRSRILPTIYHGEFFITSEQFDSESPRRYTIRRADAQGNIDSPTGFCTYKSRDEAVRGIKTLMELT